MTITGQQIYTRATKIQINAARRAGTGTSLVPLSLARIPRVAARLASLHPLAAAAPRTAARARGSRGAAAVSTSVAETSVSVAEASVSITEAIPSVSAEVHGAAAAVVHAVHPAGGRGDGHVNVVSDHELDVVKSLAVIRTLATLGHKILVRAPVSPYPVGGDCCPDVPGLTPGALSEVGVDEGEVKVGAASPGLGVDLLHQPLQLLEGGVQPGVDLQLVSRGVTWRTSVTCNITMIVIIL